MFYLFDPLTGMIRMVDPSGEEKSFRYDSLGRLTATIDENGEPQASTENYIRQTVFLDSD